jgi:hypothetical protein
MATQRQSGKHELAVEAMGDIQRLKIDMAVVKEQAASSRRVLEERILEVKRILEQQVADTTGLHREHQGLRNEIVLLRKELVHRRNADVDLEDDVRDDGWRSKHYRYAAGGAAGGGTLVVIIEAVMRALGWGG